MINLKRPPDQMISYFCDEADSNDDTIFLHRWWIVRRAKAKRFRFNIYLHKFIRSDEDRAMHDHPWWSVSFMLRGSATEHIGLPNYGGILKRKVPWLWPVFRRAEHTHRIVLNSNKPLWTIFITRGKTREWGFHCPQGWRHWKDFAFGQGCE